jgi:hypothetical protein
VKVEVPFRIIVKGPLPGVTMKIQRGRNEFLPPSSVSKFALVFNLNISADLSGERPNFLGKYSQGPKADRFVYVNSGKQAGQQGIYWDRRAKLSLMSISKQQVEEVLSSATARIETSFEGTGRDGGPTCASVKGIEWRVVRK